MKQLLEFIIRGIIGNKDFEVKEVVEGDFVNLTIKADPEDTGLIIGKQGKTIKAIRNLVKIKATLEKKGVSIYLNGSSLSTGAEAES